MGDSYINDLILTITHVYILDREIHNRRVFLLSPVVFCKALDVENQVFR